MAYVAKTWATNEVITSTALNNLEIGAEEAYLMSEQVIDADKDWAGKSISNVVLSVTEGTVVPSDTVLITASTPSPTFSVSYVVPRGYRGAVRVKNTFTLIVGTLATLEVALNGAVIDAATATTTGTSSVSADLPRVIEGDVITVSVSDAEITAATLCGTIGTSSRQIGGTPGSWV